MRFFRRRPVLLVPEAVSVPDQEQRTIQHDPGYAELRVIQERNALAVRMLWAVEPTDRALAGWSGWGLPGQGWSADR